MANHLQGGRRGLWYGILVAASAATAAGAWIGSAALYMPQADIPWFIGGTLFFLHRCSVCHSVEAGGGDLYGPNLSRIGAEAGMRIPGKTAEEYVVESIVNPSAYRVPGRTDEMPAGVSAGMSPAEVVSVAAFLLSHAGSPNYRRLARLAPSIEVPRPDPSADAPLAVLEEGRELFFNKGTCIKCHALRNLPGSNLRAPGVEYLRRHDAAYIREAIRNPSKKLFAGYEDWRVWLVSGILHTGRLVRQDSTGIELLEETDEGELVLRTFPIGEIARDANGAPQIRKSEVSSMPQDLPLTDSEIDRIILFLKTQ